MSQDNRLMPLSGFERGLDRPLTDLVQKPLGKPYGVAAESAGIKEYLFVVLKRKWLILSLVLVVTSLATIQAFRAPSIYQGESMIKIEQTAPNVLQTDKVVIQGPSDPKFWGTQLKLLENPTLARQVAITLDLQNNPAFFGGQSQGGVFTSLRRIFSSPTKPKPKPAVAPGLAVVTEQRVSAAALTPEQLSRLEPYEDAIIGGEVIEPVVGTSLVKIKFIHSDPEIAQKVANTLAEVFVNNNLERATENSTEAGDLLAREIANLQTKIKQTQEWPEVKKIDAQLEGLKKDLDRAPAEIVTSMQRRYEAAASKENLLRRSYEQQRGTTTQMTRDQIDLLSMKQQIETDKQYLNTLLQRQREVQVT